MSYLMNCRYENGEEGVVAGPFHTEGAAVEFALDTVAADGTKVEAVLSVDGEEALWIRREAIKPGMVFLSSHGYRILVTELRDTAENRSEDRTVEVVGHIHANSEREIIRERYPANTAIKVEKELPALGTIRQREDTGRSGVVVAMAPADESGNFLVRLEDSYGTTFGAYDFGLVKPDAPEREVTVEEMRWRRAGTEIVEEVNFAVYVDGAFRGTCKTRSKAEAAAQREREAPESGVEAALRIITSHPLYDPETLGITEQGTYVEHTGGGCLAVEAYIIGHRGYLMVTDWEETEDGKPLYTVGVYDQFEHTEPAEGWDFVDVEEKDLFARFAEGCAFLLKNSEPRSSERVEAEAKGEYR